MRRAATTYRKAIRSLFRQATLGDEMMRRDQMTLPLVIPRPALKPQPTEADAEDEAAGADADIGLVRESTCRADERMTADETFEEQEADRPTLTELERIKEAT